MTNLNKYPLVEKELQERERELQSIEDRKRAVEENQRMHEQRYEAREHEARKTLKSNVNVEQEIREILIAVTPQFERLVELQGIAERNEEAALALLRDANPSYWSNSGTSNHVHNLWKQMRIELGLTEAVPLLGLPAPKTPGEKMIATFGRLLRERMLVPEGIYLDEGRQRFFQYNGNRV